MSIKKTIGGDRLGAGKKMQVDLKTYGRSSHDLGYIWRSTMSSGTLVPFLKEVALPGDIFDIDLDIDVKTHPTIGPLFGSYKVQLDVFHAPIRLYQSGLHNNAIGIGMRMQDIKLPQLELHTITPQKMVDNGGDATVLTQEDYEKAANDPSSLLAHLDIVSAGLTTGVAAGVNRNFNALPLLSYWDIYKNYYANKQEEVGMYINIDEITNSVTSAIFLSSPESQDPNLPEVPEIYATDLALRRVDQITFTLENTATANDIKTILLLTIDNGITYLMPLNEAYGTITLAGSTIVCTDRTAEALASTASLQAYYQNQTERFYEPQIKSFPLENIDTMREDILSKGKFEQFLVNEDSPEPYNNVLAKYKEAGGQWIIQNKSNFSQQGLGLKTYQSDLFNNWMSTEWIDNATTGINAITAIDTSDGSFTVDALNLATKVYNMLNRIAISGGTYDDWLETVWTHEYLNRAETPVYHGGLSRELVFQEVVNVSESQDQPLGTLAGKGVMSGKKKGGKLVVKIDEPSYIMGIVSLTPRIDYSQGNKWDVNLQTMNDFHKPALDEIGYQDLITEQLAWWTTDTTQDGAVETIVQKSAGKQPAWINYMTNVNKVRGNFAKQNNQMFMTLNRRYEAIATVTGGTTTFNIEDLTTYIDPSKFNFIFAETDISSQNFWVQIATDITARRKMSAKIMPNL